MSNQTTEFDGPPASNAHISYIKEYDGKRYRVDLLDSTAPGEWYTDIVHTEIKTDQDLPPVRASGVASSPSRASEQFLHGTPTYGSKRVQPSTAPKQ